MYNGRYETLIDVIIKCDSHHKCLEVSQLVKKLCNAWSHINVSFSENKSARKGDVLSRSFMISQTAYSHDTIIFRESLNCILFFDIYNKYVTVKVRFTNPIDR